MIGTRRAMRHLRRDLGVGVLSSPRVRRTLTARAALRRWGPTSAGSYAAAAVLHPDRAAVIDEHGTVTFAELDRRSTALACGLRDLGVEAQDTVAVMCENHRGLVEAAVACTKLAASVCLLSPDIAGRDAARTLRREDIAVVICDESCAERLPTLPGRRTRVIASPGGSDGHSPTIEDLAVRFDGVPLPPPAAADRAAARVTVPTPVGPAGRRALPATLATRGAAVSRIPLRRGETTVLAAPLSSAWGVLHFTLAARLRSTLVLASVGDPVAVLAAVDRHAATALAVPADTVARMMGLPRETIDWYRTRSLRVIAVRGGQVPFELAVPMIEHFGDVIYSLRGPAMVRIDGAGLFGSPPAGVSRPAADAAPARRRTVKEFGGAPV